MVVYVEMINWPNAESNASVLSSFQEVTTNDVTSSDIRHRSAKADQKRVMFYTSWHSTMMQGLQRIKDHPGRPGAFKRSVKIF